LIGALADTLITSSHDETEEDEGEESRFLEACLDEIERYQRMDLWESSHHNTYTIAALRCKGRLMKAEKISPRLEEFLPYTKNGTSDVLCIEAFECMIDLFTVKNRLIMPYFLMVMGTDRSPYVRQELQRIFGKGLATVAMGLHKTEKVVKDVLTIDENDSTNQRQEDMKRKTSVEGAISALREELKTKHLPEKKMRAIKSSGQNGTATDDITGLQGAFEYEPEGSEPIFSCLWKAVVSPHITFQEERALLTYCKLLYQPAQQVIPRLQYPRFFTNLTHKMDGYIVVHNSPKIRFKPMTDRRIRIFPKGSSQSVQGVSKNGSRPGGSKDGAQSTISAPTGERKMLLKPPRPPPGSQAIKQEDPGEISTLPKPTLKLKIRLGGGGGGGGGSGSG
jgi:hypothetical protein